MRKRFYTYYRIQIILPETNPIKKYSRSIKKAKSICIGLANQYIKENPNRTRTITIEIEKRQCFYGRCGRYSDYFLPLVFEIFPNDKENLFLK